MSGQRAELSWCRGSTPADELVWWACRTAAARTAEADQILAVAPEVTAEDLWRVFERHHLTALAGSRLAAVGALPVELEPVVRERITLNRLRGLQHEAIGRSVIRALARADIEVLPLKGFTLAEDVHGDPGLRRYGDLDLLVRREDLHRAAVALEPLGYERYVRPGEEDLPDLHLELVHASETHPVLELHWRIHWVEDDFADAMLAASTAVNGRRRARLDHELAALLLFYARDGFLGLRLAADIATWCDATAGDWSTPPLDALASEYPGLRHTWSAALAVAEAVTGVPGRYLMSPVAATRRSSLARRLANPTGLGDPDQLWADVALVNLLLAPRRDLPAMARRHVFISGSRARDYYGPAAEGVVRRKLRQATHAGKALARFVLALFRARRH